MVNYFVVGGWHCGPKVILSLAYADQKSFVKHADNASIV